MECDHLENSHGRSMALWLVILLCAFIGCLADDPVCSNIEYLDKCPVDCAKDYCPTSEEESKQGCPPSPDPCSAPACKCGFNHRYASRDNKTCIPTRNCPPFECNRPFEEYASCPPLCPNGSCQQATPDGKCPPLLGRIGIILICNPQCRCIKNYWRQDGVCIPYAECPQNKNTTPATPAAEDQANSEDPQNPVDSENPQNPGDSENPENSEDQNCSGEQDDTNSVTATL